MNFRNQKEPTGEPGGPSAGPDAARATRAPRSIAARWWVPYMVLTITAVLTALAAGYVAVSTEEHDRAEFEAATAQIEQTLSSRIQTFVTMLRAGAGLFAAHPETTREDFRRFSEALRLRERYPGIQGIGFARRCDPTREAELVRDLQGQGLTGFRVWPAATGEGYVIAYLEPPDRRNLAALGFDMYSEPTRRAAMEEARDSGGPVTSGPVVLVQEIDEEKQKGFLVYMPVYRGRVDPGNVEARRAAILGFVYAPFRAGDLFTGILGDRGTQHLHIQVLDRGAHGSERVLFGSAPAPGDPEPRFRDTAEISVPGRPWDVRFATRPAFDRGSSRGLPPLIVTAGAVIALFLFMATRAEVRARAEAEQSAAELRAAEAQRADALSREREARAEAERLFGAEAEARRTADVANRAKDEFLATLSHELRTPLTAVLGWVRLLRGGGLDEPGRARGLEVVERNVKLQAQLIEDLLDVSRIITGKLRIDLRPIALGPVVGAAVDVLRPTADARGIGLTVTHGALDAIVVGDPDRLQQVVWNLLSNALRFTSRGGRIDVRVRRVDGQIEIAVADTGKGIPRDLLPFVFDRFRQGDGSTQRGYGGLGLGLAIVRHLVELHGGAVAAESDGEGRGSTFTVTLPEHVATERRHGRRERGAMAEPAAGALTGVEVLVVDDDADTRELVSVVLTQAGAAVTTAGSAAEALASIERARPDVMVSDIAMPNEDGYALLRAVRARRDGAEALPAVALTAHAREEDRARALAAGFQVHVPKPIDPARLLSVIADLAQRSAATA